MTAGQLIAILSNFPPETPVIKASNEGNFPYESINEYAHGPYRVLETGKLATGDLTYRDCDDENVAGAFKAIVL